MLPSLALKKIVRDRSCGTADQHEPVNARTRTAVERQAENRNRVAAATEINCQDVADDGVTVQNRLLDRGQHVRSTDTNQLRAIHSRLQSHRATHRLDQLVCSASALQRVVSGTTRQRVVPLLAVERIGEFTASDTVAATAGPNSDEPAQARESIPRIHAIEIDVVIERPRASDVEGGHSDRIVGCRISVHGQLAVGIDVDRDVVRGIDIDRYIRACNERVDSQQRASL